MAAIHALRRHWLKQTLPDDRQTLIDCFQQIKGGPHPLPLTHVDEEVKALFPDLPKGACNFVFIEALYGGRLPTATMAIALALDEIDGTPDKWVAEVFEEHRWEREESSEELEQEVG